MKEQIESLWRQCFNDSEAFIRMYFSMRYQDENCSIQTNSDGRVLSALQRIPYPMTYKGAVIPTAYIYGACTHPDYRNRGLMRALLRQAHRTMFDQGVLLSTLIPADEGLKRYYAGSGYQACFGRSVRKIPIPHEVSRNFCDQVTVAPIGNELPQHVARFIYKQQAGRSCCILHTPADLAVVTADLKLSGGNVWQAVDQQGKLLGVAFCRIEEKIVYVMESVAIDAQTNTDLMTCVGKLSAAREICYMMPDKHPKSLLGMARVVRAKDILTRYARNLSETLLLVLRDDNEIPENNGNYLLTPGHCRYFPTGVQPELDHKSRIKCLDMSVNELPEFLFAHEVPYMNLMLD